jgi:hypothetical protein
MKRAIEILNSPSSDYTPFVLEVKEPGVLRTILTGYEPPSTIIPASMGKPPEAEMIPLPALVFEVDPEGKPHKRSFVWLPAGKALDFAGALIFAATYVDERTGMPLMLYEAVAG